MPVLSFLQCRCIHETFEVSFKDQLGWYWVLLLKPFLLVSFRLSWQLPQVCSSIFLFLSCWIIKNYSFGLPLKKKKNIISIQKACSAIIYMLPTVFTFLNSIVIKIFHLVCRACQTKCESNLEELHLCYVFLVTEKFSLCKEI